jgi:hypothetical protein
MHATTNYFYASHLAAKITSPLCSLLCADLNILTRQSAAAELVWIRITLCGSASGSCFSF